MTNKHFNQILSGDKPTQRELRTIRIDVVKCMDPNRVNKTPVWIKKTNREKAYCKSRRRLNRISRNSRKSNR